jgi:tRNA (guanine37-N1)-methyltransferase
MRVDVLTLFPGILEGYLGQSLLAKAIDKRLIEVYLHDIRQWADNRHRKVDDRPFGGGPGMILQVKPVVEAVEAVQALAPRGRLIVFTPRGTTLTQPLVEDLARCPRLVLVCGRYEGFDQRVFEILEPEEISIGDYITSGGEVAAMVVIDAVSRLIPGVLGDSRSCHDDSFSAGNRLLEFPQYTRPREYRGHRVPPVLLSGNHQQIARWRREQSYLVTRRHRTDLLPPAPAGQACSPGAPPPAERIDVSTMAPVSQESQK